MCHNPRYEIRDIVAPAKIKQAMDQQAEAEVWSFVVCCSLLQCVAVYCSVAVCGSVLQSVAVCCRVGYSVCCSVLPGSSKPSPAEAKTCSCTTVFQCVAIFQCETGVYSCDSML